MIKVILCSKSDIKTKALKKWLKYKYKYNIPIITNLEIEDKFHISPEQPVDIGGVTCCYDRIRQVEKNYSNEIFNNKYIVSIENSLNIYEDKISDVVNVVIKSLGTGLLYTHTGSEISIDINILDKYPKFMDILSDFIKSYESTSKNYIFNGCTETLGDLINKYYPDIPKDNWMKTMCNKDRVNQIFDVLKNAGDAIDIDGK